ncbi:hypothetical protein G9A89_016928 [Geosiphon pyriformis]|nr:hypothetical protein G9A89_016928 [Geosiphon pyriformis]
MFFLTEIRTFIHFLCFKAFEVSRKWKFYITRLYHLRYLDVILTVGWSPVDQVLAIWNEECDLYEEDIVIVKRIYDFLRKKEYNAKILFQKVFEQRDNLKYATLLAFLYHYGIGVNIDPERAFEWYKIASEVKKDAVAQTQLGWCHSKGFGTPVDKEMAFYWYKKSTEGGYAVAACNLGNYLNERIGEKLNKQKAVINYEISAKMGYIYAQLCLGNCYYYGLGTTKNVELALMWYRIAAHAGYDEAMIQLGEVFVEDGRSETEKKIGFQWFKKAADSGSSKAMLCIGHCYYNGKGVEKNLETSFNWYLKCAKRGNFVASHWIALFYLEGSGTKRNFVKSFYWWKKAAQRPDSPNSVLYELTVCYLFPRGTNKDLHKAIELQRKVHQNSKRDTFNVHTNFSFDSFSWCNFRCLVEHQVTAVIFSHLYSSKVYSMSEPITIAVFGGSSGVGRKFVKQVLERGYKVRALVRTGSKSKALPHHENLEIVYGNAFDWLHVLATIRPASIIFQSIGPASLSDMGEYPTSKAQRTINAAVTELPKGQIKKMILISVVGIGNSCENAPALVKFGGDWVVPKLMDDKRAAENILKEFCGDSGIYWTTIRPAMMNNLKITKKYHVSEDTKITLFNACVSRADVAHFTLEEVIEKNLWLNKAITFTRC